VEVRAGRKRWKVELEEEARIDCPYMKGLAERPCVTSAGDASVCVT
jgi:hypothetical protein